MYRRNLPHWRQHGCTYFITFRTADSIPRSVLLQWQDERKHWLEAHGINAPLVTEEGVRQYLRIDIAERRRFERRQAHQLHIALDQGHGACRLTDPSNRAPISSALHHFHGDRLWCGDYVIMPNHVHWLMAPIGEWNPEKLLQAIKRFTATVLSKHGITTGHFWQTESYDRIVRDRKELRVYRQYIDQNPLKARLSESSFSVYQAPWITEALSQQLP